MAEYVCERCGHRFDIEHPDTPDFLHERATSIRLRSRPDQVR
jgi:DNA-directed RNA polymerase subunit RPC12/RpoP